MSNFKLPGCGCGRLFEFMFVSVSLILFFSAPDPSKADARSLQINSRLWQILFPACGGVWRDPTAGFVACHSQVCFSVFVDTVVISDTGQELSYNDEGYLQHV